MERAVGLKSGFTSSTMRLTTCTHCGCPAIPISDAYAVRGLVVCRPCAARLLSTQGNAVPPSEMQILVDPTICADCRADNGDRDFRLLGELPLCSKCLSHRRRIRFPYWIRVASLTCFVWGAFSLWASLNQARAIYAYREGLRAYREDRFHDGYEHLKVAHAAMPDETEFEDFESFLHGYVYLTEEKPKDAVKCFEISLKLDPRSRETARMLYISQRHAAFMEKRFTEYLKASESLLELDGPSPQALLGMAPAWACQFALTGKAEFRTKAMACLNEAHDAGGADADDWMIEGWVKVILEKRTIISLDEFRYSIGKGGMSGEISG